MSKRQDQIRFVVEQTLSELAVPPSPSFTSTLLHGFERGGEDPIGQYKAAVKLANSFPRGSPERAAAVKKALAIRAATGAKLLRPKTYAVAGAAGRAVDFIKDIPGGLAKSAISGVVNKAIGQYVLGSQTKSVGLEGLGIGSPGGEQGEQRARIT